MTAVVFVVDYGPGCRVRCEQCGLEEHYLRWQPAHAAATAHNATEHPGPPVTEAAR